MDNNDVIVFKSRKKKFTANRISSMIFPRTDIKDTEIPLKRSESKNENVLSFDPNFLPNISKDTVIKKERSQSRVLLGTIFKRTKGIQRFLITSSQFTNHYCKIKFTIS
ncbi:hypothetical protein MXB_4366 [Myxobolus squamalis]|nr:hypothetical protein MXB_4366 [Myxobolus squamalis]